jgi:hypothetical protein
MQYIITKFKSFLSNFFIINITNFNIPQTLETLKGFTLKLMSAMNTTAGGNEVLKSVHRLEGLSFYREKEILKTMLFRDVTSVPNERKHLTMVIRSVPNSFRLILD